MLRKVEDFLLYCGGLCIVSLGGVITITVILRNFFNTGVPDVVTIVGELMLGGIFLPLAYVTRNYQHIAIDFLFKRLGCQLRLLLLSLGSLVVLGPMLLLVMASWGAFNHSVESGSYFSGELELPEWPGRFFFFIGAALFYIRLLIIFFQDVLALFSNNSDYLRKRTDSRDAIEEG